MSQRYVGFELQRFFLRRMRERGKGELFLVLVLEQEGFKTQRWESPRFKVAKGQEVFPPSVLVLLDYQSGMPARVSAAVFDDDGEPRERALDAFEAAIKSAPARVAIGSTTGKILSAGGRALSKVLRRDDELATRVFEIGVDYVCGTSLIGSQADKAEATVFWQKTDTNRAAFGDPLTSGAGN